jgi:hypothetical protein
MPRLKDRVKTYPDSVQLAQVLQGRDDALVVVFSSQAGGAAAAEPLLLIDSGLHEPLQYKAVASAAKETDPAVVAFLRWLAEDTQTQQALGGYGLLDRDTALGNRAAVIAGGMPQPEDQPITAPKEAPAPGQPAPQAPETKSPPAGN